MRQLSKKERIAWGERVAGTIDARFARLRLEILVLTGLEYVAPILSAAHRYTSWTFEAPLARRTIGQRIAWLKSQVPPPRSQKRLRGRT